MGADNCSPGPAGTRSDSRELVACHRVFLYRSGICLVCGGETCPSFDSVGGWGRRARRDENKHAESGIKEYYSNIFLAATGRYCGYCVNNPNTIFTLCIPPISQKCRFFRQHEIFPPSLTQWLISSPEVKVWVLGLCLLFFNIGLPQ